MSAKPVLKLDWCSHAAAKYACEKWHYSKKIPVGKLVKIGVWEADRFIGAVIFSRGANNHLASQYELRQTDIAELTRVALTVHSHPVSRIVAISLRLLHAFVPGCRVIISYADPDQGHHGGIYQALGWLYLGTSTPQRGLLVGGKFLHKRTASATYGTASPQKIHSGSVSSAYGTRSVQRLRSAGLDIQYGPLQYKHKYLLVLDHTLSQQFSLLAQPYPKRAGSIQDAPSVQPGEGGATPTPALHTPQH